MKVSGLAGFMIAARLPTKIGTAKNGHKGNIQEDKKGQGVYSGWQANVDCSITIRLLIISD